MQLHADFHMHSTFSDGTDTPEQLLEYVKQAGIDYFSLTDHDCLEGGSVIRQRIQPGDPVFVNGIEFSCRDEIGKLHVLGYGYNIENRQIWDAVSFTHAARMEKARNSFRYLENLGYVFPEEEIDEVLKMKNPGKPHFVSLMLKHGYVDEWGKAFDILYHYHGKEPELTPNQAIAAILASGGVPVLAHGILADGRGNLTEEQLRVRVAQLADMGLMGIECFYSTFTEYQKELMLELAGQYGMLVTAGSDYHGKTKEVQLGQINLDDPEKLYPFMECLKIL